MNTFCYGTVRLGMSTLMAVAFPELALISVPSGNSCLIDSKRTLLKLNPVYRDLATDEDSSRNQGRRRG